MAARRPAQKRPRKKGKVPGRRFGTALIGVLILAVALVCGAVVLSQRGYTPFRFAEPESEHRHDTEITEQDRQRLREVLESIDRAVERK